MGVQDMMDRRKGVWQGETLGGGGEEEAGLMNK